MKGLLRPKVILLRPELNVKRVLPLGPIVERLPSLGLDVEQLPHLQLDVE